MFYKKRETVERKKDPGQTVVGVGGYFTAVYSFQSFFVYGDDLVPATIRVKDVPGLAEKLKDQQAQIKALEGQVARLLDAVPSAGERA